MSRTNAGYVDQHQFAQIESANFPRSAFDRTSSIITSMNEGYLYPVWVDEVLPGDTITLKPMIFARMATPLFPLMDNMYLDCHVWSVPLRILWTNFKRFMGEQPNPGDTTDFLTPQVESEVGGFLRNSIADYMGLPPKAHAGQTVVNAFWHRAYAMIWNEWYRDENLQDRTFFSDGDGPDDAADYPLLKRGKRKDYFTSALPWPQKGNAVSLPLGTSAPIISGGTGVPTFLDRGNVNDTHYNLTVGGSPGAGAAAVTASVSSQAPTGQVAGDPLTWLDPALAVDLASATAATINQLRTAFQIQRLYERDARGGTRYVELIRSHFGIANAGGDATLQRPEYLGGGTIPVDVNAVATTTYTTGKFVGDLAGYATAIGPIGPINKTFTEHSVILAIVSIRADMRYQQGINRMFSRRTKHDFYWPTLAALGEQAVLNKEIFHDGTAADDDVWGYQERYAEYRYKPSLITGTMRSTHPVGLDAWHLGYEFTTRPALNDEFIQENPPVSRVVAVPTQPHFIMDSQWALRHVRPMPLNGTPGMIDHF